MLTESLRRAALIVVLLSWMAAPVQAQEDEEIDLDLIARVESLQAEAIAAVRAEEWSRARELAETVLTLDDTVRTAPARMVLVQALDREHQYGAALYELRCYLDLDVSDEARTRAERILVRLEELKARGTRGDQRAKPRTERATSPPRARSKRASEPSLAGAVGLLVGGAVPAAIGLGFVGTDVYWSSQQVESGTWAAIGVPLAAVGLALDVAGLVALIHRSRLRARSSAAQLSAPQPSIHVGVARAGSRWQLTLGGAW